MELWERQEKENDSRWGAFQLYRDMSPNERNLSKVARELGKNKSLLHRWSREDKWLDRVKAFDEHMDAEITAKRIINSAEMNERHIKLAQDVLNKVAEGLKYVDPMDMKCGDIAKLIDVATKLERLARGDATEVLENREGESIVQAVQFYMPSNGRDGESTDNTN